MQQRRWLPSLSTIPLIIASALFSAIPVAEGAVTGTQVDEFDIKDDDNSSFFNWLPGETYDPRTSTVGYYVTDFQASGTGLDITINRKFNMAIEPMTNGSVYPKSFGTMMLDTPRLEYTTYHSNDKTRQCNGLVVYNQNQSASGSKKISGSGLTFHANNSSVKFFPKSLGSYPANRFPSNAVYVSANNWYIDCSGTTFRVHKPNGIVYHLNDYEYYKDVKSIRLGASAVPIGLRSNTKKTVYVSTIVDPHNNTLTYTYDIQKREWIGKTFDQKVLKSIKASDDREVTIELEPISGDVPFEHRNQCPPTVSKISYKQDSSKNVIYQYDSRSGPDATACQLHLNRVVRQDNSKFHYEYNYFIDDSNFPLVNGKKWAELDENGEDVSNSQVRHAIKSITYPEGAKVSYEYTPLEQCAFTSKITVNSTEAKKTCGIIAALGKRSITGDLIPAGMTWNFTTQEIAAGEDDEGVQQPDRFRSVIDGPSVKGRRTRQIFDYVVKNTNRNLSLVDARNGKLKEHQVIDIPANYSHTGVLMKKTRYTWGFYGDVVDFTKLKSWNSSQKFAWQHLYHSRGRHIQEKNIWFDEHHFKTVYTGFDQYGNATRKAQYQDTLGRTVVLKYLNRLNPWIIGKVSKKTVEKVDGSNDFMLLDRTFHSTGKVNGERINGLFNSYTYHANGELNTVKSGDNIQTDIFANYILGVPRTVSRASSTGTVQKNVRLFSSGRVKTESAWGKPIVLTQFQYDSIGKLKKIDRHTIKDMKIINPDWDDSNSEDHRRKYTTVGALYRNTTHYDTLGRPLIQDEQDPGNGDRVFTYYRYDANGRLAYQSLPVSDHLHLGQYYSGNTITPAGYTFEYDVFGRLIKKQHTVSGGPATHYCYRALTCGRSNLLGGHSNKLDYGEASIDSEGYIVITNYRALGNPSDKQVIEIKQQKNHGNQFVTTTINRDLIHRISSVTQNGITRSYTYKPGTLLLASAAHPETGTTSYTSYDNRGNLKEKKTADNAITNYAYYPNNLLRAINYPSGTANMAFTYYNDDSLKSLIRGGVTREFTYRDDGLLASETLKVDNETMILGYEYDDYGFVNKTMYPSGKSVSQTNNSLGWVKGISNVTSDMHYASNGQLTQIKFANGQIFTSTQDSQDRVKKWQTSDDYNIVLNLIYDHDNRGNIKSLKDLISPSHNINMTYDGLSRLTEADSTGLWGGTGVVEYNNNGDIKKLELGTEQLDYHYTPGFSNGRTNLLHHVNSSSGLNNFLFKYDRNGNVTDNGKRSFIYDKANSMTHADAGGRVYGFVYDGDGRRVRSIRQDTNSNNTPIASTKVTQYFFYNSAGKLMYEKNKNTGMRKDHIYANGKAIAERHYYNSLIDTDDDGIPNHYEELYGLQPDNDNDAYDDSDNDGVSNYQEFTHGSNPNSLDTDNDGLNDWMEADYGLNIAEDDSAGDLDGDGVSNYNEVIAGTHPADTLMRQRMKAIVPIMEILLAPDTQ